MPRLAFKSWGASEEAHETVKGLATVLLTLGIAGLLCACTSSGAQPPYRGGYGTAPWWGYYGQTVIVDPGYPKDEPIATPLPEPPPENPDIDIPDMGMPDMGGDDF